MSLTSLHRHQKEREKLRKTLRGNDKRIKVKKKTVSNLFRYGQRNLQDALLVDLTPFNHVLSINIEAKTLDVQGLTTFEQIAEQTLPKRLLPQITPELKHITIGGAIVGIGIESNCHKFGFVHDSLLEAEVLLPDGRIVLCRPDNDHADLFHALANSYGTFGYILRAKIKLHSVKSYASLSTIKLDNVSEFIDRMEEAVNDTSIDFIESLFYSKNELYLVTTKMVDTPDNLSSIYNSNVFYKMISQPGQFCLPIEEYIFRYDPEWFWNLPETGFYQFFRKFAPKSMRNSSFYSRYIKFKEKLLRKLPFLNPQQEPIEQLIQDWEVPWSEAKALVTFALENVDLGKSPWLGTPIISPANATIYPMRTGQLYFNLGCYCYVNKVHGKDKYYYTKIMDDFCFKHDGIKMLYSSTFISQDEFDRIYNGQAYKDTKSKYDPLGRTPSLFEKAVQFK